MRLRLHAHKMTTPLTYFTKIKEWEKTSPKCGPSFLSCCLCNKNPPPKITNTNETSFHTSWYNNAFFHHNDTKKNLHPTHKKNLHKINNIHIQQHGQNITKTNFTMTIIKICCLLSTIKKWSGNLDQTLVKQN